MSLSLLMLRIQAIVMPRIILIRMGYIPWLLCVVTLVGCRDSYFDPTEDLPAYPGVSSDLQILGKGDERMLALQDWGVTNDSDRAVVIQQVIHNDSNDRLGVFKNPPFQAELILVKTTEGTRIPLSAKGQEYKRERYSKVGLFPIDPHDMDKREYILTRLFDLSKPGTYTVEIESRYKIYGKWDAGYFETNPEPITFEVK